MLPSGPTLRHALVVGVDGVRFDLLNVEVTPVIWAFARPASWPRPGWRACERAMWEEAAALKPGSDPALRSFHDEGIRALGIFDLTRRVMTIATSP